MRKTYEPPVNPIWSIERALKQGYAMEPHVGSGDFSGPLRMNSPGHDCALKTAAIYRDMRAKVDGEYGKGAMCRVQCAECAHICHMNDYIRAKEHCPPHYPMPALHVDSVADLGERWLCRIDTDALCGVRW